MEKYIENNGPLLITMIVTALLKYNINYFFPLIQPKAEVITNITITLTGIFLSFIGAMYGILISLKDTSLVKRLNDYNIVSRIKRYTKISFHANGFTLLVSLWFLISKEDSAQYNEYEVIFQISSLLFIFCASCRMLRILGAFVDTIDQPQHKQEKIHHPSFNGK